MSGKNSELSKKEIEKEILDIFGRKVINANFYERLSAELGNRFEKKVVDVVKKELETMITSISEYDKELTKDRELTKTETITYLLGYFELGESVEEIAVEHHRRPQFVRMVIEKEEDSKNPIIAYFKEKGAKKVNTFTCLT